MRINRCVCLCQRNGARRGERWTDTERVVAAGARATTVTTTVCLALFFVLFLAPSPPSLSLSLSLSSFASLTPSLYRRACVHFYQLLRTPGACVCSRAGGRVAVSARDVCTVTGCRGGVYPGDTPVVCAGDTRCPAVFLFLSRGGIRAAGVFCSLFLACRGH